MIGRENLEALFDIAIANDDKAQITRLLILSGVEELLYKVDSIGKQLLKDDGEPSDEFKTLLP